MSSRRQRSIPSCGHNRQISLYHGVHDPRKLTACSTNSLFRHTTKNASKLRISARFLGKSTSHQRTPSQRATNAESALMPWRRHEGVPEWSIKKDTLVISAVSLCMGSANEKRRYIVTSSLIGWAHTQNNPCIYISYDRWHPTNEMSPVSLQLSIGATYGRRNQTHTCNLTHAKITPPAVLCT